MLIGIEDRIALVEAELRVVDENGQSAWEAALDQSNFTMLHEQYETIHEEFLNTLHS
jgi:hypothetical protein